MRENMWSEFFLVKVSIWCACGLWFVGAYARSLPRSTSKASFERAYRWSWFGAGLSTWVHIVASYGLVHGWNHESVLKQTGDESFAVVGFRVPWGVYANFVFAAVLLGYSVAMIRTQARITRIDSWVHLFLAFIVFNAMIVFKTGPIRWAGLIAFTLLVVSDPRCRLLGEFKEQNASGPDKFLPSEQNDETRVG